MEKYNNEDPIQKNFRKKLEESGVKFATENTNRQLTKEEIKERKRKAQEEEKK